MRYAQLVSFLKIGMRYVNDVKLLKTTMWVHVFFERAGEAQLFFIFPLEFHKVNQKDSILDLDYLRLAFLQYEECPLLPNY